MGDNTICILNTFWDTHTIIPRQRGFFGTPFPAERGVTQGDIISPTIFNIVIDCVLHHWYQSMQDNNHTTTTLRFYADDGLLAGPNAISLQFGVNEIAQLFLTFGLQLNGPKTKAMISFPKTPNTALSQQAYHHRITGQGPTHLQCTRTMVTCTKCDKSVQQGNLIRHLKLVHKELPGLEALPLDDDPNTTTVISRLLYITSIPDATTPSICPIPECAMPITSRSGMKSHFNHRHPYKHLIILEEGYLPRCPKCLLHSCDITKHMLTQHCNLGSAREEYRQLEHDRPAVLATTFTINNTTIETVPAFKYLGRWLRFDDDDLLAILQNIEGA